MIELDILHFQSAYFDLHYLLTHFLFLPENTPQFRKLIRIDKLFFKRKTRSAAATVLDLLTRKEPFSFGESDASLFDSFLFLRSVKSRETRTDFRAYESARIELVLYRNLGSGTSTPDKREENRMDTLIEK